jgi:hypothetical protein
MTRGGAEEHDVKVCAVMERPETRLGNFWEDRPLEGL